MTQMKYTECFNPFIDQNDQKNTLYGIKEVSPVEATANVFGMWAGSAISVGACMAGAKLLVLALAC